MFNSKMLDLAFQAKAFVALAALIFASSIVRSKLGGRRRLPLPPGPPGHWLIGNAIPREKYATIHRTIEHEADAFNFSQSQQFAAWISQYGPIISLRIGPKTMIIIGRYKVGSLRVSRVKLSALTHHKK
ncbi:hypothetical protein JVU11DRAFT_5565 [Chiua virens]|nr:hypothetical protein JVU11DRAFT_5565 [Chiua virens]